MLCNSCDCFFINGVKCHEHGCPDSWKDYVRKCKFCGCEFKPEDKNQTCCSEDCTQSYWGD